MVMFFEGRTLNSLNYERLMCHAAEGDSNCVILISAPYLAFR